MYGALTAWSLYKQKGVLLTSLFTGCKNKHLVTVNVKLAVMQHRLFCSRLGGLAHSKLNELVNGPAGLFPWPFGVWMSDIGVGAAKQGDWTGFMKNRQNKKNYIYSYRYSIPCLIIGDYHNKEIVSNYTKTTNGTITSQHCGTNNTTQMFFNRLKRCRLKLQLIDLASLHILKYVQYIILKLFLLIPHFICYLKYLHPFN